MSKNGHDVFVSEYNAPKDFELIWQKSIKQNMSKSANNIDVVENLFKFKNF